MTRRIERVNGLLRQELSQLISRSVKDPRLVGIITVTQVETSADLRHAKVFISVLGSHGQRETTIKGISSASGFMRKELGNRLSLKTIPHLTFFLDEGLEMAEHIYQLMDDLASERTSSPAGGTNHPEEQQQS